MWKNCKMRKNMVQGRVSDLNISVIRWIPVRGSVEQMEDIWKADEGLECRSLDIMSWILLLLAKVTS
jgi:hypothetical protein